MPAAVRPDDSLNVLLTHVYSWPAVRRGGERYLHELGAGLRRAGHRPIILSTSARAAAGSLDDVPVRWLRARAGPRRFGDAAPEVAFAAAALAWSQAHRPVVWHALGTADAAAATLASPWSHPASVYTDLGIPDRGWRQGRPDWRLFARVLKHVDAYVTLSDHAAERLESGFGRRPDVVPGGIRLNAFTPEQRDPRPTLLYSGTLTEPRKGVADLLRAAVTLRSKIPDLQVWLSGPGDPAPLLAEVPGATEVVTRTLLDSRDDLSRLYARAWATALLSVDEAQGLTVIESLASGTPAVVRADGGGPPELVDATCGVLAGPAPEDQAEALRAGLDLAHRRETVEACRARASLYDWDQVIVPRIVGLYRQVM